MLQFCLFDTAIGPCALVWRDGCIVGAQLPEADVEVARGRLLRRFPGAEEAPAAAFVMQAIEDIRALLAGETRDLSHLPITLDGASPFERQVYEVALSIPPGETMTYGDVARRLGEPGAARAVGVALGLVVGGDVGARVEVLEVVDAVDRRFGEPGAARVPSDDVEVLEQAAPLGTGDQLIDLSADDLAGRDSCSHGRRSSFVSWEALEGTYARRLLHHRMDATAGCRFAVRDQRLVRLAVTSAIMISAAELQDRAAVRSIG